MIERKKFFTNSNNYGKQGVFYREDFDRTAEGEPTADESEKQNGVDRAIKYFEEKLVNGVNSHSEVASLDEKGNFSIIKVSKCWWKLSGFLASDPESFYKLAKQIEEVRPEWHFTFEDDRSNLKFKYTVAKS